ncbi:glycerate kinase [Limosilactobacillus sp. STM2_1]|uniref:Glycerate kinase n=1 Tax=Limosilactobacillus rudii TaxID=2759755 RepID=A0A7W3UKS4_9LACO|nr:glycerate kinase [Limosilactobacillus rudii]MBB1079331.1 glycerate kinase [Limosilactobacillus rudii]MBB1097377.1 glycerate kinase [Limosilactobacillus rudii]MCD7134486.1 glycerate kinase [Limosilactobacillus rudii]
MKFLIAPDSFKGSLTAKEAANAIAMGIMRIFPQADYEIIPMADGGEGTVQSLVDATGGKIMTANVHNPLGKIVRAKYGLLGNSRTAVIEMAAASGIQYLNKETKNPMITSTYGTGELIRAALDQNVDQIIIGLGGSATIDGGAGMAQALGVRLLSSDGQEIQLGGGGLADLKHVDTTALDSRLQRTKIIIASDVTNPLTGKDGAAVVFGPQKGATNKMISQLDRNLHHFAMIVTRNLGESLEYTAGGGAAGGLGFGLLAFTNAEMRKGIEIVTEYSHLAEKAVDSDYVFTGEGGMDFQTKFGKTPYGVAKVAKRVAPTAHVIALTGKIGAGVESLYEDGIIDAIFSTPNGAKSLTQAINDANDDIAIVAENVARLIKLTKKD